MGGSYPMPYGRPMPMYNNNRRMQGSFSNDYDDDSDGLVGQFTSALGKRQIDMDIDERRAMTSFNMA